MLGEQSAVRAWPASCLHHGVAPRVSACGALQGVSRCDVSFSGHCGPLRLLVFLRRPRPRPSPSPPRCTAATKSRASSPVRSGTATVTWNLATKAGTYRVDVYNMPVGTTASHFHAGAAGVGGPVIVNFTVPAGGISNDFAFSGTFGCTDVVVARGPGHQLVRGLRAGAAARQHLRERPLARRIPAAKSAASVDSRSSNRSDASRARTARTVSGPMKLSVVMPAYNEQATIRTIVARVLAVDLGSVEKELVIVDDGSKDGTRDILKELDGKDGVRVLVPAAQPGQGRRGVARHARVDRRHGDHPGRRPRIRSARISAS